MKNPKSTWPSTRTPAERDEDFADALLLGIYHWDENGDFVKFELPSRNTSPTEKEGREALARVLRSGNVPRRILNALADQIEPGGEHQFRLRRIEFKNLSQGHSQDTAHYFIARQVYGLRKKGEKNAIAKVAKEIGKDTRHVAKIYSKYRDQLKWQEAELLDGVSYETAAMASDK